MNHTNQLHQHLQQQQQQMQQQGQLAKLLESNQTTTINGTIHSNTNSNFFTSPALSAQSNRRLANSSFFERFKYRLNKKLRAYCSWKCLAMLFLFITLNLFMFIIYLAGLYIFAF